MPDAAHTIDAAAIVGTHDIVFITLDSLRYDVAQAAMEAGETPHLTSVLGSWEPRHTPATFTLPAHAAFFAGFLPTPVCNPKSAALFACRFPGRETVGPTTFCFDETSLPEAMAARDYRTVCIGGVSFFNPSVALGAVLPSMFGTSHWSPAYAPGRRRGAHAQSRKACEIVARHDDSVDNGGPQWLFLFLNVAVTHHPTHRYVEGATRDSVRTQQAALRLVDDGLGPLFSVLQSRRPSLLIVCADHGEAFGEDGYWGHRLSHPTVLTVPYGHAILGRNP